MTLGFIYIATHETVALPGAYSDGGGICANNGEATTVLRQIACHGQVGRCQPIHVGVKSRVDTLHAANLFTKQANFEEKKVVHQQVVARYATIFASDVLKSLPPIVLPHTASVYAKYTIRVQENLTAAGFPTAVHYLPLNKKPTVADVAMQLAGADEAEEQLISLPMGPYLTAPQKHQIA